MCVHGDDQTWPARQHLLLKYWLSGTAVDTSDTGIAGAGYLQWSEPDRGARGI